MCRLLLLIRGASGTDTISYKTLNVWRLVE